MAFLFSKTIHFLLLSYMVPILHIHTNAELFSVCRPATTTNTTFQNNLDLLLTSLSSNLAHSSFYNTSTGENPNRVYGLAQCVPHVNPTACVNCINMAIQNIHLYCPGATDGFTFENECILHYSNESFFSILDNSANGYGIDVKNVSDTVRFTPFLKEMLSKLSRQAAFDPSSSMFAAGDATFTSTEEVHAVVLCTRDLSANDCNACLQDILEETLKYCSSCRKVNSLSNSCNLRYEVLDSDASSGGRPAPLSSTITAKPSYFEVFMLLMSLALVAN